MLLRNRQPKISNIPRCLALHKKINNLWFDKPYFWLKIKKSTNQRARRDTDLKLIRKEEEIENTVSYYYQWTRMNIFEGKIPMALAKKP
jgi:hypothetical protein